MNTSQYMDKQIMDLSKSQQANTDFIDLINPPQEDHEGDDDGKKEEIVPSYDFQPIRPPRQQSALDSGSGGGVGGGARVWNSADSVSTSPAAVAVRNYSSLDSIEPAKAILEKDHNASHAALVTEIDRTMKKHADNLMHALEGVSARISQLESRSRNLESSVDDLKDIVGNNQGSTDGKLRQLENILREVQSGVQIIRDKQGILEGQLHLAKLQVSKEDHKPEPQSHIHPDSFPHHQPITLSPLSLSPPNAPPPAPQQNLQNQYSQNQIPPPPQRDSYYPPPSHPQETTTQPQQMPQYPPQYSQPPPPPHHQLSLSSMNPPQQPPPPPHHLLSLSSMNPPQPPSHHPEDSPYPPPQSYPPSSQQFYNSPSHIYEPPSGRPNSGYSSMNEPPQYPYGGPPSNYIKQHLSSSPPQLPTARILPQALPTASGVGDGSGSGSGSGSGNRVPIDDVVDKVTNMGFSREQVRATVRKLTENGQSVDLNIVLDKLMNDGVEGQPPRGWFGR